MPTGYVQGQIVEILATFSNDAGLAVDPSTVQLRYVVTTTQTITGTPTPTVLSYSGASTPAVGVVARTGIGAFQAQVDTTNAAGFYSYEWISTGTGQAASPPSQFYVAPRKF